MTQIIYSAKTEIGNLDSIERVRITKFVDGEVEASYLTTFTECDCPAGVRPSCRHRQMLPQMSAARIVNTEWFWDYDLGRPVDFDGQLKSNMEAMNELAVTPEMVEDAKEYIDSSPSLWPAKSNGWRRF